MTFYKCRLDNKPRLYLFATNKYKIGYKTKIIKGFYLVSLEIVGFVPNKTEIKFESSIEIIENAEFEAKKI